VTAARAFFFLVLLVSCIAAPARARTPTEREVELFRQGNAAYEASDFKAAAEAYETLLEGGLESRDVYYNLGNAYLKEGRIGTAILNYRRALELDSSDDDARANLAYARRRTQDATPQDAPDPLPWLTAIRPGAEQAGWFYLIGLNLTAILFAAWRIVRRPAVLGTLAGIAAAITVAVGIGFFFETRAETMRNGGVVLAESAEVRSGPGADYTVAFVIHEGTEVEVGRSAGGFTEITVTPELKGWVAAEAVESISS
jgi:hypothetical protein